MKINVSFENFKKKHKKRKNQILFVEKRCLNYKKEQNIEFSSMFSKNNILKFLKNSKQ